MEYFFKDYSVYVDGTVITILLLSTIFAFYRGLVKEVLGFGSWIITSIAIIYAIPASKPFTENNFENELIADISVGIITAITVLVICTLITHKSSNKVRNSFLSGLDRTLGGFYGLLRGFLIVLIFYFIAGFFFEKEIKHQSNNSFFIPYLDYITEDTRKLLENYTKKEDDMDEILKQLNYPEIKPKNNDNEGYKDKERRSLDQLFLETSE